MKIRGEGKVGRTKVRGFWCGAKVRGDV